MPSESRIGLFHISVLLRTEPNPSEVRIMKRVVIGICLALLIVAGVSSLSGRAQSAAVPGQEATGNSPPANPPGFRLHWYKVGQNPLGMAFDGANIWTANFSDGTVSKLRASDGKNLGTFYVSGAPIGVTFDGGNIWVSDTV
jgi:hypothetical protein